MTAKAKTKPKAKAKPAAKTKTKTKTKTNAKTKAKPAAKPSRAGKSDARKRLDAAFKELGANGIVAMHAVGYTMSDGWEDTNDEARARRDAGASPRGGTFYHGQDVERGKRGEGLFLAYGAYVDGKGHEAASLAVAAEIVATLKKHGFTPAWDGTIDQRIHTGPFPWH